MGNLTFQGVSFGQIFKNLTVNLAAGRRVGLTGPNASGKTTLLRLLAGWLAWEQGVFCIGELDQTILTPERRQLVFLPSQAALYSHWTVLENIVFPARSLGVVDRSSVLIEDMGLTELVARKARQLSQGESQRVAWARALNRPARWLLADEALAHLDGAQRQIVWNALERHWPGGLLLVTHQLQQDLPWLDELYCLEHGLQQIDLQRLEQNPGSLWLASQLRSENVWPGELLGWPPGQWWVPAEAWLDDPAGIEVKWLEQRGALWKVKVYGRYLWLIRRQPGARLTPKREVAALLEDSRL